MLFERRHHFRYLQKAYAFIFLAILFKRYAWHHDTYGITTGSLRCFDFREVFHEFIID